jgi:hypothetical protein
MELLYLTSTLVTKLLEIMPMEFLLDAQRQKSTMLYWLLAMELKMELIIGWSRTLGVQTGAMEARSRSGVELANVALEATAMLLSVLSQLELFLTLQSLHHPSQSHLSRSAMFPSLTPV